MALSGPGTVADTLTKTNENTVKEYIGNETFNLLRDGANTPFQDIVLDSAQQYMSMPDTGYGRNYKKITTFHGSLAGTVQSAGPSSYFNVAGDATSNLGNRLQRNSASPSAWPNAFSAQASPQAFRMASTIHSHLMNLGITAAELREEANPANIRKFYDVKLKGLSKQLELRVANEWFTDSEGTLCSFTGTTTATTTADNTANTIEFRPTEGVISRFEIGQEVDVYANDTNAPDLDGANGTNAVGRLNSVATTGVRVPGFVEYVAPDREIVRIVFAGTTKQNMTTTFNGTAKFYVTLSNHNASGTAHKIYGWQDWAKAGTVGSATAATAANSRILGSRADTTDFIDVNQHPEFKSYYANIGGALDKITLMNHTSSIHRLFNHYGHKLDTALVSYGILEDLVEQQVALQRLEVSQKPLGNDPYQPDPYNFKMMVHGQNLDVMVSDCIEAGTILMLRRQGNWRISTINEGRAGETASGVPNMPSKIPVYSPLIGQDNMFRPVEEASTGVTLQTEQYDMPLYSTFQIEPVEQIPMAVLTGIDDNREYGTPGAIDLIS